MSEKKHKHKKHHTVLPYITTPVIFVLISMVIVLPLSIGMLSFAVNTVHKAQKTLIYSAADVSLDDSKYAPSDQESGSAVIPTMYSCEKVGEIVCRQAGLNTAVYMGYNRVSDRGGAGLSFRAAFPGQGEPIKIYGNTSGGMKALENVKQGDVIIFQTKWGLYQYKVTQCVVSKEEPKLEGGEVLLLSTAADKEAFSALDEEQLYVTAKYVSGPKAEEVQE